MVDRYRLLTEVSPDVVFVHQNGRLVYGNRAAARLTGEVSTDEEYSQAFAKHYGRPMTDFMHPADIPDVAERLAQLTEQGQFFEHGECRVVATDGTVTMMEVTSVRTVWAGEPAFQVIARDISERRAAESANRYRASLVAHVSDAIIGIDADGMIESWNEAAQAIYGWTEDEVAGMSIGAVVTANRTDSAAVLERGQRTHRARTAPRSTCWSPSTHSSTTTPSRRAGWWCAPSSPTPDRPRPVAGPPRSATRRWWPR